MVLEGIQVRADMLQAAVEGMVAQMEGQQFRVEHTGAVPHNPWDTVRPAFQELEHTPVQVVDRLPWVARHIPEHILVA